MKPSTHEGRVLRLVGWPQWPRSKSVNRAAANGAEATSERPGSASDERRFMAEPRPKRSTQDGPSRAVEPAPPGVSLLAHRSRHYRDWL
jgi:hypothetical protein